MATALHAKSPFYQLMSNDVGLSRARIPSTEQSPSIPSPSKNVLLLRSRVAPHHPTQMFTVDHGTYTSTNVETPKSTVYDTLGLYGMKLSQSSSNGHWLATFGAFEYRGKPPTVTKLQKQSPTERATAFTRTPMRQAPLESWQFFTSPLELKAQLGTRAYNVYGVALELKVPTTLGCGHAVPPPACAPEPLR